MVEQMVMIMKMVMAMVIKFSDLEKKKEKNKWAQDKGEIDRSFFCFGDRDT